VEKQGQFDVVRFWETLALILSHRENANITVKVTVEGGAGESETGIPAAEKKPA